MQELPPSLKGIYPIECRLTGPRAPVKCYLLSNEKELVLVDAGDSTQDADNILKYIQSLGNKPADLTLCILTHKHSDHIGGGSGEGLIKLKKACGFQLASHELEAADIEKLTGLRIDHRIKDEDELNYFGGLRIIHVPGHTPGSLCIYAKRNKVLIMGDAVFSAGGWLIPTPSYLTVDSSAAVNSLKRLVDLDFEAVLVAHGENVWHDAKRMFSLMFLNSFMEFEKTFSPDERRSIFRGGR